MPPNRIHADTLSQGPDSVPSPLPVREKQAAAVTPSMLLKGESIFAVDNALLERPWSVRFDFPKLFFICCLQPFLLDQRVHYLEV